MKTTDKNFPYELSQQFIIDSLKLIPEMVKWQQHVYETEMAIAERAFGDIKLPDVAVRLNDSVKKP